MLVELAAVVAVVLVILVILVAVRPNELRVSRSATIAAPPVAVFPHVNDLRRWHAWSPWAKRDPIMKVTYSGLDAGTGAHYAWEGDKNVGQGSMTIMESRPNELILLRLEFLKPFKAKNTTEFRFEPVDGQTRVVWTMWGKNNFIAKAMGLVMNMDKMIGNDFEKGLTDLKTIVEAEFKPA